MRYKTDTDLHVETGLGKFFFDDMSNEEIKKVLPIEFIARSLSRECRFMGLTEKFYSVAQHSVIVSYMVRPELAMAGLLHDMVEVIVRDQPTPFKRHAGKEYQDIITDLEQKLQEAYEVPEINFPEIINADSRLLQIEIDTLFSNKDTLYVTDNLGHVVIEDPKESEKLFLRRYYELRPTEKK